LICRLCQGFSLPSAREGKLGEWGSRARLLHWPLRLGRTGKSEASKSTAALFHLFILLSNATESKLTEAPAGGSTLLPSRVQLAKTEPRKDGVRLARRGCLRLRRVRRDGVGWFCLSKAREVEPSDCPAR
jgi:hypothetical protein